MQEKKEKSFSNKENTFKSIEAERFILSVQAIINDGRANSFSQIAKSVGFSSQDFTDIKSGKKDLPRKFLDLIVEKYGIDKKFILTGEKSTQNEENNKRFYSDGINSANTPPILNSNESATKKGIPMYSNSATASELEVYDDMLNDGPAFFVNIPQFRDCSFGKMVFGHSMYPTYESGSYIFCKPVSDKFHIVPGEIYYIEYDNFGVCKRLQLSDNADEYLAESDNEEIRADGLKRYRTFPIKIDKIRAIFLVKGLFKQSQN